MTFDEFVKAVRTGIAGIFDDGKTVVSASEVVKNNGLVLTGINIREKGRNIIPTIYIDDFYREDMDNYDIDNIVSQIKQVYSSRCDGISNCSDLDETEKYSDYHWVSDKIFFTLVNFELNKKLLKTIPYIRFHDLAVIFRCVFHRGENGMASSVISNIDIKRWGIDKKILYSQAVFNTPRLFPPVVEKIAAILEDRAMMPEHIFEEIIGDAGDMYVLTNSSGLNGAAAILYEEVLDECAKKAGGNIYVLPSSIHEMIFLNENLVDDEEELTGIVKDVNDNVVNRVELLSYNVYYYNCYSKQLSVISAL